MVPPSQSNVSSEDGICGMRQWTEKIVNGKAVPYIGGTCKRGTMTAVPRGSSAQEEVPAWYCSG